MRQVLHVPEFDIAHAQVTVSQYAAFLTSREFSEQRWWGTEGWAWLCGAGEGWGRENRWQPEGWEVQRGYFDHPVTGVTFYEAEAYCHWLSDEKKRRVRLPTEAEWERAARGDDERPFPWGQEFDSRFTNTHESGRKRTSPVGDTPGDLSPFGLSNMAGNVQEWTTSLYTLLPGEVCPPGPLYVARGGSFNDTAYAARVSYRRPYPLGYFYPFLGFRIVVSAV
jgi:formylglycine-generating enzyme required for sulfatase activity